MKLSPEEVFAFGAQMGMNYGADSELQQLVYNVTGEYVDEPAQPDVKNFELDYAFTYIILSINVSNAKWTLIIILMQFRNK